LAASEHDIMRMHEIDAELDIMQRAVRSRKEIRRRQRELMAPRLKVLENTHVAYLESKTKRTSRDTPTRGGRILELGVFTWSPLLS
jgi:hypothetical protein